MQQDSIQIRTAVKMLIKYILEHRQRLEQEIHEQQREAAKLYLEEQAHQLPKGKFTSSNTSEQD
ncbi:MAG: hypothetical protein R2932_48400 [Caldilineaceae bacterium]